MKPNYLLRNRILLIFVISLALYSCQKNQYEFVRDLDFNPDWKYQIADEERASNPNYDDGVWKNVDLPHDWSIEDYHLQDSLHTGPFFKNQAQGADIGYLRTGTCWYRKYWKTPRKLEDKQVILNFDGVQTQSELWINGEFVGENVYGYSPFNFNITNYLNAPGKENLIAVKTVNSGENSRWFAGAGIYRNVRLSILNPVSIAPWGVSFSTPDVSKVKASVEFEVTLNNFNSDHADVSCSVTLEGTGKNIIELKSEKIQIEQNSNNTIAIKGAVNNPMLWSPEKPNLYMANIRIRKEDQIMDEYTIKIGIRSIDFSPENGFLLNGESVLLKGGCMHHANGLLGAAAFKDAEYRRVRIMKENGYNAIRTSHNPPSTEFLNACDELGMLVIDEAFDHWMKAKRPKDYSNYFEKWYKKDIQAMVMRDRNHPSVIIWSFGNEVQERADPEGIEIGKNLIAAIKEIDSTRPTTQAVCGFWDNPGKEWDYSAGAFAISEIQGYNYQYENYEGDHKKYPERIMFGSESVPKQAWDYWEMVKSHAYVIGDFVWTGMDYIGESGIGHTIESTDPQTNASGLPPWPWYNSWCGDIDLIGNKKPQSYYRDIIWDESKLEILVHQPVEKGFYEIVSYWGWPKEEQSWNWEKEKREALKVRIFTSYPKVALELNGRLLGEKKIRKEDKYIAEFTVPYEPGTLKAMAYSGGSLMETKVIQTSGEVKRIHLNPESNTFEAARSKIIYIQVDAQDEQGLSCNDSDTELEVSVDGPGELLAAGNAYPKIQGSFTDAEFRLYRGKGLIIIRSSGEPGDIIVHVKNEQLGKTSMHLTAL